MTNGEPPVEGQEISLTIIEVFNTSEGPYVEHKEITTSPIKSLAL